MDSSKKNVHEHGIRFGRGGLFSATDKDLPFKFGRFFYSFPLRPNGRLWPSRSCPPSHEPRFVPPQWNPSANGIRLKFKFFPLFPSLTRRNSALPKPPWWTSKWPAEASARPNWYGQWETGIRALCALTGCPRRVEVRTYRVRWIFLPFYSSPAGPSALLFFLSSFSLLTGLDTNSVVNNNKCLYINLKSTTKKGELNNTVWFIYTAGFKFPR